MLFVQKTELQFMVCVARRGLGYWTGALTDARGGGLTWCIEAWGVGGHAGTVQPGRRGGWLGLPLSFGSPKLSIYSIHHLGHLAPPLPHGSRPAMAPL
jgi:hypothetical protein